MTSYLSIQHHLKLGQELPYTENWSAAADFLELIINHCLHIKPASILECSSGLTSLVLARCCQLNNFGQVHSLENGKEYAEKTIQQLTSFGLEQYVNVVHAPLETNNINNQDYMWYSTKDLPHLPIDMLVIDGPPGFIQKHSRYPALPLLYNQLADHCVIFLDDAARDDEKALVEMWLKTYPNIEHEYIETERGCSKITIKKNL
ncbi:MAG: class I SAM-dependent methyltransferase [Gammaproteobacteria bacterium]|nr:class I SAM-dependent methyltransferase [Gammaproteobacteria bacterium]